MKSFCVLFLLFTIGSGCGYSQVTQNPDAADILLRMKKLNVLGSVLYVAAHPDDENTRLLAWLSKEKNYRTGYLSLTRGDGGQNLIGDEQGVELGLIRTQELLAARRIDGAEQFFSRAFDFGYSKTTAEALRLWDEKKILGDVVWVIRNFRPDVMITRFPEDGRAGHGQHSASSVLAHRAFAAAADPKQFPEQLKNGVKPWQVKRLFWNNYNFGNENNIRPDELNIGVGGYNSLLGKSYGEVAADSRSQHRSQGFGVARNRGESREYFSLTAGTKADTALLDGVDAGWSRVPGAAAISQQVNDLTKAYSAADPSASLPALLEIVRSIAALPDGYWKEEKAREVAALVQDCTGLWLEGNVRQAYVVAGKPVSVALGMINRSRVPISLEGLEMNGKDSAVKIDLAPGRNETLNITFPTAGLPVSQPYWLAEPMTGASYTVSDQSMIGRPENPPAIEVGFRIIIAGRHFIFRKPVKYLHTDPARGEIVEPLIIIPAALATCKPDVLLFPNSSPRTISVTLFGKTGPGEAKTSLTAPNGFSVSSATVPGEFAVTPVSSDPIVGWTRAVQTVPGAAADSLMQWRSISYEHIPRIDYFKPARTRLVSTELTVKGSRIGYIDGAGDKVADALKQMGYIVTAITESNLNSESLAGLDAVITGVRAYDVHPWLFEKYETLMDYVKNGGNLIVQYNRDNSDAFRTRTGPYPFSISNSRVTEEDASVNFIHAEDPVLKSPNRISARDFEGWIQERGIYFAGQSDSRYRQVFSMHDAGESDQKGSLIIAPLGKGTFTYTGLVFFRELPAGVPGAFRLLANLIAQRPQNP